MASSAWNEDSGAPEDKFPPLRQSPRVTSHSQFSSSAAIGSVHAVPARAANFGATITVFSMRPDSTAAAVAMRNEVAALLSAPWMFTTTCVMSGLATVRGWFLKTSIRPAVPIGRNSVHVDVADTHCAVCASGAEGKASTRSTNGSATATFCMRRILADVTQTAGLIAADE
jgi:hypothetical protein